MPAPRPVVIYDGDCGFCTASARFLEQRIGAGAEVIASQRADLQALGLTAADADRAVQFIDTDRTIRSGHDAVAAALATGRGVWRQIGRFGALPGVRTIGRWIYPIIARNRHRLPGGTAACRIDQRP